MNRTWLCAVVGVSAAAIGIASICGAAPSLKTMVAARGARVGDPAPGWTMSDTKGKTHSLAQYAGKYVVLEWTNHQCPYVQAQYRTGNMQATQKWAVDHGVVWLSVISSAPGSQGYVTPEQGEELLKAQHAYATAKVFDPEGTVGHAYGAKTTPDMMVINPKGVLIYSGAIDDKASADDAELKTAHNYVKAALEEAMAGKPVSTPTSQPFGCAVKYAH